MYAKITHKTFRLKQHHHIRVDSELHNDCKVWLSFLDSDNIHLFCRPFIDIRGLITADDVKLYSDSSVNEELGFGGLFKDSEYFWGRWEYGYIQKYQPSIEYLELFAVCVGLNLAGSATE